MQLCVSKTQEHAAAIGKLHGLSRLDVAPVVRVQTGQESRSTTSSRPSPRTGVPLCSQVSWTSNETKAPPRGSSAFADWLARSNARNVSAERRAFDVRVATSVPQTAAVARPEVRVAEGGGMLEAEPQDAIEGDVRDPSSGRREQPWCC